MLGTGKWILSAIVDSKNKDLAFFIGPDAQKSINAKLQAIAVPRDMEREPRSLEYIKRWKGTRNKVLRIHFARTSTYQKGLISHLTLRCTRGVGGEKWFPLRFFSVFISS